AHVWSMWSMGCIGTMRTGSMLLSFLAVLDIAGSRAGVPAVAPRMDGRQPQTLTDNHGTCATDCTVAAPRHPPLTECVAAGALHWGLPMRGSGDVVQTCQGSVDAMPPLAAKILPSLTPTVPARRIARRSA